MYLKRVTNGYHLITEEFQAIEQKMSQIRSLYASDQWTVSTVPDTGETQATNRETGTHIIWEIQ